MRTTRLVAWLILLSKLLSIGSVLSAGHAPPEVKKAFLMIRLPDLAVNVLIVLLIQFSSPISPILRLLLLLSVILVVIVESTLTRPLHGWAFSWVNFAAVIGSLLAFEPIRERKYAYTGIGITLILSMMGLLLHPYLSYINAGDSIQSLGRFILITLAVGVVGILTFDHYAKTFGDATTFSDQLERSLSIQQSLSDEALRQKSIAEQRQAEAEAALAEIARLREAEHRRLEQQRVLIQYETLMREGYLQDLSRFAQRVMETFGREHLLLGGFFYAREGNGWRIVAAYAFPEDIGGFIQSGLLDMVAKLKQSHVITPVPSGTKCPKASLHVPQAKAIFYLPFYSEASGETVALVELLLAQSVSKEMREVYEQILPRIGTYLWMRLQQEGNATERTAQNLI
ncbi:MAG: hypothetical protein ABDH66_07510 [Bacteroidia bacterium]